MYNVTVNRTLKYNYTLNGSLMITVLQPQGCRRPAVDDPAKSHAQFPGAVSWGSVWICRSPSCDSFYSCGNYGDGIRSCPNILQCFRTFAIVCVRMFDQPVCHRNNPMFGTDVSGASFVSARHPVLSISKFRTICSIFSIKFFFLLPKEYRHRVFCLRYCCIPTLF